MLITISSEILNEFGQRIILIVVGMTASEDNEICVRRPVGLNFGFLSNHTVAPRVGNISRRGQYQN